MADELTITGEDGREIAARLTLPAAETGPGLLLLPDKDGLTEPLQGFADYLAEDGYVVLTPDLSARYGADDAIGDVRAALLVLSGKLADDAKIGVVGSGEGATLALLGAAELGLEAVIAYDPTGMEGKAFTGLACPTVVHLSGDDAAAKIEDLATQLPADARIYAYENSEPGFAFSGGASYDKWPARVSYSRTLAPLRRVLGPHHDLAGLLWEHLRYEFETKDADATMGTMVDAPYVNHIPTMTGGVGHDFLKRFYKYHFIPQQPEDRDNVVLSETVGADTVVLEIMNRFTHTKMFDHMLPGIEPTGKYVEFPVVVVAKFRGDQLYHEHIYWDHASLLKQLGVLDTGGLPVAGIEAAKKLMDETLPSNALMPNWADSEGKPI